MVKGLRATGMNESDAAELKGSLERICKEVDLDADGSIDMGEFTHAAVQQHMDKWCMKVVAQPLAPDSYVFSAMGVNPH